MLAHLRFISSIALYASAAFLMGCDSSLESNDRTPVQNTLLTVNNESLTQDDLPMADQLKLFNSEFQLHQLTLASLRETIEKKHLPSDHLNWTVSSPIAPTISLNLEASWQTTINENKQHNDNITFDIMCSYASRPCSDIMSAIEEFSLHTDLNIHIKFYDFWQPYHKNAQQAAAAVYCSDKQAKTQLQKALWLRQGNIDMGQLTSNIDIYNHNTNKASSVYACMQSKETIGFLQNNHKALQAAGFRQTPSILVNGQYISRGSEVSQVFNSLYPHMNLAIEQGDRSVTWLQSWLGDSAIGTQPNKTNDNKNWAILEHQGQVLRLEKGSNITNMYLAQIKQDNIIIYKNGRLLSFGQAPSKALTQTVVETHTPSTQQTYSQTDASFDETETEIEQEAETDHQARYENMVANIKPQSLPQAWLEEQLMRQGELEESLFHTDGKIEGKALVKLNKESIDEFYSSLGMMPGDVIMRVNDDWIHEESNTLFQSLANEEKVTISVMRKGLPVHLAFEVTQ